MPGIATVGVGAVVSGIAVVLFAGFASQTGNPGIGVLVGLLAVLAVFVPQFFTGDL
ncbi:hypothetical protein [Haloarchaeobius sp. TZWWS8]|uniref:hypothetical protein n=1 Tax=Haloarchaeobius sp. TZWWS8 TaxID=3446121 RepID=UPI003EBE5284